MKNINLLLILFASSSCFAQQNDTCESYTKQAINNFYNNNILNSKVKTDTLYFHQFFDVVTKEKMQKFVKWARENGYETIQKTFEVTIGTRATETSHMIIIEKILDDAAEYKHVVLGLIFLKYISDAFEVATCNIVGFGSQFHSV